SLDGHIAQPVRRQARRRARSDGARPGAAPRAAEVARRGCQATAAAQEEEVAMTIPEVETVRGTSVLETSAHTSAETAIAEAAGGAAARVPAPTRLGISGAQLMAHYRLCTFAASSLDLCQRTGSWSLKTATSRGRPQKRRSV